MKHILLTTIAAVLPAGCGLWGPSEAERALVGAAESGNIEAVKQHIAAGTDVNAKDMNGETSLTWAAYSGHKEIAELLLANGARLISFEAYELGSIWGDEPKRSISPAQE